MKTLRQNSQAQSIRLYLHNQTNMEAKSLPECFHVAVEAITIPKMPNCLCRLRFFQTVMSSLIWHNLCSGDPPSSKNSMKMSGSCRLSFCSPNEDFYAQTRRDRNREGERLPYKGFKLTLFKNVCSISKILKFPIWRLMDTLYECFLFLPNLLPRGVMNATV